MHYSDYFQTLENAFVEWLQRQGYQNTTQQGHRQRSRFFFQYLQSKQVQILENVTPQIIKDYEVYLDHLPLGSRTISSYLSTLRLLDEYLQHYGETPILTTKLKVTPDLETERVIFTQAEIKALYEVVNDDAVGYRDRAILGLYYGCGLRASEGLKLKVEDVYLDTGLLHVRRGKYYRNRYVPLSPLVQKHLQAWLRFARPLILTKPSDLVLVHTKGGYKNAASFGNRLEKIRANTDITKKITLHSLRHSIASHLLENGMELEHIRQFLGHKSLEITQIYTHVQ